MQLSTSLTITWKSMFFKVILFFYSYMFTAYNVHIHHGNLHVYMICLNFFQPISSLQPLPSPLLKALFSFLPFFLFVNSFSLLFFLPPVCFLYLNKFFLLPSICSPFCYFFTYWVSHTREAMQYLNLCV